MRAALFAAAGGIAALILGLPLAVVAASGAQPAPLGAGGPPAVRVAAVVAAARAQLGHPYVWGGGDASGPTGGTDGVFPPGFDCSGLMLYAWARAGVSLPHSSPEQYRAGPHVPLSQARPGDMIFLATDTATPATIHHVAMVYTPGWIIEAQTFGVPVHIRPFAGTGEPEIMPYVVRLVP
jgi:cell wall-associated NlpC family hydrolase